MDPYLQKIKEGKYTLIVKRSRRVVFRSNCPGILDLAIAAKKGFLKQATIYDKTIGLAAAKIAVFSGVKEIFSLMSSSLALAFCQKRKIPLYTEKIVERVYDHKKGNECHLEKMAQKTNKISDLINSVIFN